VNKFIEKEQFHKQNKAKAGLKVGCRFLKFEEGIEIWGISMVLMTGWYILDQMNEEEVDKAIQLSVKGKYPKLV
jgi:hypothetical protein